MKNRTIATTARRWRMPLLTVACAVFLLTQAASEARAATMYDRFKDIYQTPQKVDELESEYKASQEKLQAQAEELKQRAELMQSQTEQYQAETKALNERNEALAAQNDALSAQLAEMTRKQEARAALTRKGAYSVAAVLGMGLLYMLTVRLWRYSVWRRQRSGSWRT